MVKVHVEHGALMVLCLKPFFIFFVCAGLVLTGTAVCVIGVLHDAVLIVKPVSVVDVLDGRY